MSDLFDAISRGDLPAVEAALAGGAKANEKRHGQSAFDAAMRAKQPAIARLLLQSGADARKAAIYLCAAIQLGDPLLVRAILDVGADPNMNPPGGRPLQFAVQARSPEIARMLIEAGADVNAGSHISTPLADAVKIGEEEIALMLIEEGACGDAETPAPSPLAIAVGKGQTRIVAELLKRGVDPHSRATLNEAHLRDDGNLRGMALVAATKNVLYKNAPLLHIAAGEGRASLVKLLLAQGADPAEVDDEGQTALAIAEKRQQAEAAQVLRDAGGDAPPKISPELSLLIAAQDGDVEGVRRAVAQGANLNVNDDRQETIGMTPLILATVNGHLEVVRQLLEAGADPNATDAVPGTKPSPMLAYLYREGGIEAVEAAGLTLGRTALMHAAGEGELEIVRVLLAAGADANAKDLMKETALSIATEAKKKAIVAALREAGAATSKSARSKDAQAKKKTPQAAKTKKAPRVKKVSETRLKHYARDAVLKRLTKKVGGAAFQQIVKRLADQCGAKPVPLGDEATFGYSIHVRARKQIDLEALQNELQSEGAFVFAAESDGNRIDRIAVIPSDDKYDALAAVGTNGANLDLAPRDVIRWLLELEQEQPFAITGVAFDWVDGYFTAPIADPEGLAKRMYKFCPDLVDQGVGDVASLAETLREPRPRLYFWWD